MIESFKVIDKTTGKEADSSDVWVERGGHPAYRNKARFWLCSDGDLSLFDAVGNEIDVDQERYEAVTV